MAKSIGNLTSWIAGISFSEKEGVANSYAFGRAIDHRSEPTQITLNPRAELDSGSVVTDLPMWMTRACTRTFAYGDTGNLYQKTTGNWSLVHTANDSVGNGMEYFAQDKALYYTQNTTFGRLLDACTESTFYDDFKASEGGAPTNTKSIDFEASSSMYASRADTASLSITADLTLEAYIAPESLPSTNDVMTLISKWDENTNLRSYKMDITTVTDFFGDGGDGALTIAANTTEAPIDSACAGTSGTYALTATNASFAADQKIMIHQTRGTNAGVTQYTSISSYTAGTIATKDALDISFNSTGSNKAQVRVLKQYTNVTVNTGKTYTAKAWNGTVGGILGFYASGTTTITGTITATGKGFRGGTGRVGSKIYSYCGEGTGGASAIGTSTVRNGNGGGSAYSGDNASFGAGGGGGGNSTSGTTGNAYGGTPGQGGSISGSTNLTTMTFGGGGSGGCKNSTYQGLNGAIGGGIVAILSKANVITGSISANGNTATSDTANPDSTGGGGGGGSVIFKVQTATLGTNKIQATGGSGGTSEHENQDGGDGSTGRIHVDYLTSVSGTTSPAYSSAEDPNLGSSDGYVLRLLISDDGTAVDTFSQEITADIATGVWNHWAVSWENTTKTAKFYVDGTLLGTKTGTMTAIDDNASVFNVACDFDTTAQNFYDGLMDSARVWNDVRTATELATNRDKILYGTESNLVAYYQFESGVTDSQTDGNNDLTATNTPTYSDDVPFSGVTTRPDEDQKNDQTGQTYTLPVAISEAADQRQTFVPTKDPQKSIELDIDTVGTGNWTLTVHDALNREVATVTVAVAQIHTGVYEFTFASVWRPIIDASYHFHVTSSVADGVVVTGTTVDLETARYWSHYQFLVEDKYHPMKEMLDFMVMGNERYLGKFEAGGTFDPHKLTFPSGYRVRCLAYWREFLAIGCWKGSNITDFDDGRIFFWDGIKDSYNHSIPVPEGGVNSMFGTQDVLFITAGYSGEQLIYTGGGAAQKFNKVPKLERDEYVEIAPGAMNTWRSMIHTGVNLLTDSTNLHQGVYTIGTAQRNYPSSLGFDYPLSLGDQTDTNVKVGVVYPSGQDLYIGWQNYNAFGIDKIAVDNDVYDSGTVELLITDLGQISKKKYPLILRIDFEKLVNGQRIRVKHKLDRADSWTIGDWEDTVDATNTRLRIKKRCHEIQIAIDLETTVATGPTLLGTTLEVEGGGPRNA